MDSAAPAPPRAKWGRRRKLGVWVGAFALAVSATIPVFETADAPRFRRLMEAHSGKAAECRRLEREAQAAGRAEEVQLLARSASNFERFAAIYEIQLRQNRFGWLTWLVRPSMRQ